jgi:hypothetical protein
MAAAAADGERRDDGNGAVNSKGFSAKRRVSENNRDLYVNNRIAVINRDPN